MIEKLGSTSTGNETLLVVEDNTLVRQLVTRILRDHGFNVFEAANGMEALALAKKNSGQCIHLLLSDIGLPLMGGEELARRFLQVRPHTRVLFISGNTDAAFLHDGQSQSPENFLQKPFTPEQLVSKVRLTLQS